MTSPSPVLTTVAALSGLGLTLAALALAAAAVRRRLDALAARVAALEARSDPEPAPVSRPVAAPAPVTVKVRRVNRPAPAVPTLIAVPNLAAEAVSPGAAGSELGRRYAAIWERADAGEPAEAIARATGQPVGQVELILGLQRRRPAHPKARPS